MGFFDRIFGREEQQPARQQPRPQSPDEQALERYRYLLRTAPPDAVEQAHAEAFAQLTPEQRRQVLQSLANEVPAHERAVRDDPRSLARMATRAEMRQPGVLERSFGGMGGGYGGPGFGSMFASSLLGSVAGYVIGSAIADQFFANDPGFADASADYGSGDAQSELAGGGGGWESGGWDSGVDVSDI